MNGTTSTSAPLYLVTGAAGFVGGHLVRHLAAKGVRVRAMVRKVAQADALRDVVEDVVVADLRDADSLAGAARGVDGVYNIAALFRQEGVDPAEFREINAEGVRRMLDASIAAGVRRFVHCSTIGVHGHVADPPADETAPLAPGDLYQESKLEGEQIAMRYFCEGRIGGVAIRPAMIYGPGDMRTLKLFRMIERGMFFYVNRGAALTHWVDVRDLVEGFRLAMAAGHINAEVFLIAGQKYRPLRETAREIARQLGVSPPWLNVPVAPMMILARITEAVCKPIGVEPPLYRRRVAFFLKNRAFDWSKAARMLGYAPRQTFEGEVADIIASYRGSGLLRRR